METHPLQSYMDQKGLMVSDFANISGLSEQAVYKIINFERVRPREDTIAKIEKATGGYIDRNVLLGITPAKSATKHKPPK